MVDGVSWFGRDPAQVTAQAVSAAIALVMLLPLAEGLSGALCALVVAIGGLVVAFAVARDGQLAAITGVGRALIALAVVVGLPWSETYQALLLVAVEQVAGFFIRDRVQARVTDVGARVRDPSSDRQAA